MRLSSIFGLAWRTIREERLRSFFSALIISFGVAMSIAAEFVSQALLAAFGDLGEGDLQITHGFLVEQLDLMLGGIGYVLLAAAAFLIFNTFAMTIVQRRNQIGMLRCLGMTRRQLLHLVLLEALLIGGFGTGIGLIAGPLLGEGIVIMMRLLAGDIIAFGVGSFSAGTVLQAAAMGMGVTLAAVLSPAWRATRVSPLAALRGEDEMPDATFFYDRKTEARKEPRQPAHSEMRLTRRHLALLTTVLLFLYLGLFPPGAWLQPPWNGLVSALLIAIWLICLLVMLPALLYKTGAVARRFWGQSANGRLAADNLQRAPGRSLLTAVTLAIGLTTIISLTGLMTFAFDELFGFTFDQMVRQEMWALFPFDLERGTAALDGLDALQLPPAQIDAFMQDVGERAEIIPVRFATVPELSFLGSTYFTFIVDPPALKDGFFTLQEGDWETAVPILEKGCGALVAPAVARRNGVQIGELFTITGRDGPVRCTLAGIGAGFVNASILGPGAAEMVGTTGIVALTIIPHPDANRELLIADMQQIADRSDRSYLTSMRSYNELIEEAITLFSAALNGILLLAVAAAALGVVNTMMISVNERRHELGLLRAVGATRRQVTAVVTGEAMLIGILGGIGGLAAGCGIILIFAVTYGGNSWGVPHLDLWGAAARSLRAAVGTGVAGLIITPAISAAAARGPARSILRGTAVQTLQAVPPQPAPHRAANRAATAGRALPLSLVVLLLFYYWFAVADRYRVFLYDHDMGPVVPDTSPFSPTTSSRYWMAGLVAGGAIMVLDTAVLFLRGRLQPHYHPSSWLKTWLLAAGPLLVGLPLITMNANEPTLPLLNGLQVTAVSLLALALALQPGRLAARRPDRLAWLIVDGAGLFLLLQPVAALDDLERWIAAGSNGQLILLIAFFATGLGWLLLGSGLQRWRRRTPERIGPFLAGGVLFSYLLMPLVHHVVGSDGYFYISDAANFFSDRFWVQLSGWLLVGFLGLGIIRLRTLITIRK